MRKHNRTLLKQRIMGIVMLLVSYALILMGEATGILITIPLGLFMLFSKEAFIFED